MNRFRIIEDGLCCDVFYDKSRTNNEVALFLYGFPATIGENELTVKLVERGYMVLQPHYYGTYDSKGDFTPETAFKTVESIVNIARKSLVKNLKNNSMMHIPPNISLCIGYSFGAFVLRHSMDYLMDVDKVILVSPVMSNNPNNELCWANENALEHLQYVMRTRPYTYRITNIDAWMRQYVNDEKREKTSRDNNVRKVFWLYGKDDEAIVSRKIDDSYIFATQNFIGKYADAKIVAVENGGHGINTLINEETMMHIDSFLCLSI